MSNDRKAIGLLTLLVLLTTLPFLKRAYFVDDFYFVTIARGILQHPLRPYDFRSDDAGIQTIGWERGQRPRMVNPLLFHYYLAGVMKLFGDASWKLRASTILFSLVTVWSMYFLGKRFVPYPLAAASLMAITPAYWLTSYSLLIDSGLIAFFMLSLLIFIEGFDQRRVSWILAAGVLMGLTMLVKYVGALVLLLALVWQVMDKSRRAWWPGYLSYFLAGGLMLLWGIWNIATYGQMHFLAALPRGMAAPSLVGWAQKSVVLGSFIGGSVVFVLLCLPMLWRVSWAWLVGLLLVAAGFFGLFSSRVGGFSLSQSALLSLFITGTASFLIVMGRTLRTSEDKNHLFLAVWILIGMSELVVVMPWTAGRYLLIILPPMCWVFQLLVEEFGGRPLWRTAWVLTALTGLSLAYADYAQANTIKQLAHMLAGKSAELEALSDRRQHHWYYLADTFDGSQPYLQALGWENVFPFQTFQPGDLFLKSHYRKSSWWTMDHPERFKLIWMDPINSVLPLRVMDVPASAGFYASCWGALPFAVTNHPLEQFELYLVVK